VRYAALLKEFRAGTAEMVKRKTQVLDRNPFRGFQESWNYAALGRTNYTCCRYKRERIL